MKQVLESQTQPDYAMRIRLFILKPFQITKVLEILYMLDWIWYAILSLLPSRYISGSLFETLRPILFQQLISALFALIASIHVIGLWRNNILLRKVALIINVLVLTFFAVNTLQHFPVPSGVGYLIILIGVTIFAFLRMDETH